MQLSTFNYECAPSRSPAPVHLCQPPLAQSGNGFPQTAVSPPVKRPLPLRDKATPTVTRVSHGGGEGGRRARRWRLCSPSATTPAWEHVPAKLRALTRLTSG